MPRSTSLWKQVAVYGIILNDLLRTSDVGERKSSILILKVRGSEDLAILRQIRKVLSFIPRERQLYELVRVLVV